MIETRKTASSVSGPRTTQVLTQNAVKGIPQRFWKFTREMASKFSRHLMKNRDEELLDALSREFKDV